LQGNDLRIYLCLHCITVNNNNNNTPESCLENDSYKLYFDRTILTDIHIKHNRPDIIILNKQQKQAYNTDI
jgi:hypothetical protein